jgi:hypothetical protein
MINKFYYKYDYHLSKDKEYMELILGGILQSYSWSYSQHKSISKNIGVNHHAYIEILCGFNYSNDYAKQWLISLEAIGFPNNTH